MVMGGKLSLFIWHTSVGSCFFFSLTMYSFNTYMHVFLKSGPGGNSYLH